MVKYSDNQENEKTHFDFVEIIDPRGNSYKFLMDVTLAPGQHLMLPRKAEQKINESDGTEYTTETEEFKAINHSEPIPDKKPSPDEDPDQK